MFNPNSFNMDVNDTFGTFDDVSSALLEPQEMDFQFLNSIPVSNEHSLGFEPAAVQALSGVNGDVNGLNGLNGSQPCQTFPTFSNASSDPQNLSNTFVDSSMAHFEVPSQTVSPQALLYQSQTFDPQTSVSTQTYNAGFQTLPGEQIQPHHLLPAQPGQLIPAQPQIFTTPDLLLQQPIHFSSTDFEQSFDLDLQSDLRSLFGVVPSQIGSQVQPVIECSLQTQPVNQVQPQVEGQSLENPVQMLPTPPLENFEPEKLQIPPPPLDLVNPIVEPTEFETWESSMEFYAPLRFSPNNKDDMDKFEAMIQKDFDKIQCESELVRNLLYSIFPNPYTSMFNVAAQEKSPEKEKPDRYRYTWGRKDDVYSSMWYRIDTKGAEREGGERYCALCKSWHKTRNHSWANHQSSVHGISAVTKSIYPFPTGVVLDPKSMVPEQSSRKKSLEPQGPKLKGYCRKCNGFVHLYNKQNGGKYTTWFRHQDAHFRQEMQEKRGGKIHTPNNPRNSKKRKLDESPKASSSQSSSQSKSPSKSSSESANVESANEIISVQLNLKRRRVAGDSKGKEKGEEQQDDNQTNIDTGEEVEAVEGDDDEGHFSEDTIGNLMEQIEAEEAEEAESDESESYSNEADKTPTPDNSDTVITTSTSDTKEAVVEKLSPIPEEVTDDKPSPTNTEETVGDSETVVGSATVDSTMVDSQTIDSETAPAIDFTQNPFLCDFDETHMFNINMSGLGEMQGDDQTLSV